MLDEYDLLFISFCIIPVNLVGGFNSLSNFKFGLGD